MMHFMGSIRHVRVLGIDPRVITPTRRTLRVGNGLDRLADLLRQLDDDPCGAADVAEAVAVLVALQLADELSRGCEQCRRALSGGLTSAPRPP